MGLNELREAYDYPEKMPEVNVLRHGWPRAETAYFFRRTLNPSVKCIVEVGSWLGSGVRLMNTCAPNATIICVDNWKGTESYKEAKLNGEPIIPLYETFLVNTWDLKDTIIPVKEDSVVGIKRIKELGVVPELIYVDAGHRYEEVMNDITTSIECFPDCFICGDDYNWGDVRKAVNDYGKKHNLIVGCVDSIWWYEK